MMSKLIRSQRKGKSSAYSDRFLKKGVAYSTLRILKTFKIDSFVTNPKTQTVTAKIGQHYLPGIKSQYLGQEIVPKKIGDLPLGTQIANIELNPYGRSYVCRSAGTSAIITDKTDNKVTFQIKGSNRKITVQNTCLCLEGVIGTGEKKIKPLLKAGNAYYKYKARGKKYPNVSAHKMNIYAHPLGGSYRKHMGVKMTRSRHLPPGAKYGSISAKRTGRKK